MGWNSKRLIAEAAPMTSAHDIRAKVVPLDSPPGRVLVQGDHTVLYGIRRHRGRRHSTEAALSQLARASRWPLVPLADPPRPRHSAELPTSRRLYGVLPLAIPSVPSPWKKPALSAPGNCSINRRNTGSVRSSGMGASHILGTRFRSSRFLPSPADSCTGHCLRVPSERSMTPTRGVL